MIVGRSIERERIGALLAGARRGEAGVLVLRGEAGIGKTTLLEQSVASAEGMAVLRATGVETEADLAFAGLSDLVRPVRAAIAELPPGPRDALRGALALEGETVNPLAVRVGLLELLAACAEDATLLVAVDDVQWVDDASLAVLAFAARRLTVERVAVLVTQRGDAPVALARRGSDVLDVTRLDDGDARSLLAGRVATASVDRAVAFSAGNPLALLELPWSGAGADREAAPSPVGSRVVDAFGQRLGRLPAPARRAIGLVAAAGAADAVTVARVATTLGLSLPDLAPAEDDGLVVVEEGQVALRHPVLRSVAYQALSPVDRRAVHGALAAALDAPADAARRTWHRAAATDGPDEEVATALETIAADAERRAAVPTAAEAFARAAALSATPDARAHRLVLSADAWLAAGRWTKARERLDEADRHAVAPEVRADAAAVRAQVEAFTRGPAVAREGLLAAAADVEATHPDRAARLYAYAVHMAVYDVDIRAAQSLAARADACGERAGGLHTAVGDMAVAEAGLLAGDAGAAARIEPLVASAASLITSDLELAEHVFGMVVMSRVIVEEWDAADGLLDVMVDRSRDTGRSFLLATALAFRVELDLRRGRWREAYLRATTDLVEAPADAPGVTAWVDAVQCRVEAGLGLVADARAHGTAALAVADELGLGAVELWARAALGLLELGVGRLPAAIAHLEAVADAARDGGLGAPGLLWWMADLVEAHWRRGDLPAARRHLDVLHAQAAATGSVWAHGAAARGEGLLADSASDAEAAFAVSQATLTTLGAPFAVARTLLVQGERRRSCRDPSAGAPLGAAQAAFEQLGAAPWAARARTLLGAASPVRPTASLTRQERQVATVVGAGATNREAAERLFVSSRTIDFHLSNIYRKLGIRSRTELAVLVARGEAGLGAEPADAVVIPAAANGPADAPA